MIVRAGIKTAAIALAIAAVAGAPSLARGETASLVVEAAEAPAPLYSGSVETAPHFVDGGDGSGPHPCSGPSGSSPTATGALDDALRGAGIPWRGNWDPSIGDFFIDRIGAYASAAPDRYWALTVNGRFTPGGCQTAISAGDAIRFRYGPLFGADPGGEAGSQPPSEDGPSAAGGAGPVEAGKAHGTSARMLARRAARFLRRRAVDVVGADWAALALALRHGRRPGGAAARLAERLRRLPGGRPIGRDIDLTALSAWSLAARGRGERAHRAAMTVRAAQNPDGGFPILPGGDSNAQSTGVALIALRVAGLGPRPCAEPGGPTPLDYLASLARRDGSLAYAPGSRLTPVWTTAQALLGLTSRARLLALETTGRSG